MPQAPWREPGRFDTNIGPYLLLHIKWLAKDDEQKGTSLKSSNRRLNIFHQVCHISGNPQISVGEIILFAKLLHKGAHIGELCVEIRHKSVLAATIQIGK